MANEPRSYKNEFLELSALLFVFTVGYFAAGGFTQTQESAIDLLKASSGPVALLALVVSLRSNRKAREAAAKEADDRQQQEWDKRDKEAVESRNILRRSIRKAIIAELQTCHQKVISDKEMVLEDMAEGEAHYPMSINYFRPIFDKLGPDLALLKPEYLQVIAYFEPTFQESLQDLKEAHAYLKRSNDSPTADEVEWVDKKISIFAETIKDYIEYLKDPKGFA